MTEPINRSADGQTNLHHLMHRCVTEHIFSAEQAHGVAEMIGRHADTINGEGFGEIAHAMQVAMGARMTLSITKIFEEKHRRYPNRSLPVLLEHLEKTAEQLEILNRDHVTERLAARLGTGTETLKTWSDAELTRALASNIRNTLPNVESFKFHRDKTVAHAEDYDQAEALRATWDEGVELIRYAQEVVGFIATAYTRLVLQDDSGDYLLSYDAGNAARQMGRLLKRAGLTSETAIARHAARIERAMDDEV